MWIPVWLLVVLAILAWSGLQAAAKSGELGEAADVWLVNGGFLVALPLVVLGPVAAAVAWLLGFELFAARSLWVAAFALAWFVVGQVYDHYFGFSSALKVSQK